MLIYADLFDHLDQGNIVYFNLNGYVDVSAFMRQVFPGNVTINRIVTYEGYNRFLMSIVAGALGGNAIEFERQTGGLGDGGYLTVQMPILTLNAAAKHYFAFRMQRNGGIESETLFALNDGFYAGDTTPSATSKVLYVKADGTLSIGGVDSATAIISTGVYAFVEVEIDPVADIINVYVDKALVITKSASGWFSGGLQRLGIMYWNSQGMSSSSSVRMRFDDIMCWDYTGTGVFSEYPLSLLKVTPTPINSQVNDEWSNVGGAVSKLAALTDKTSGKYFNVATYASSKTPGKKDTFGIDGSQITGTPVAVVCAPVITQNALSPAPMASVEFEDSVTYNSQDIEWQNAGGTPSCPPIPFHIEQMPSGSVLDLSALKIGYKIK